jgi:hypothetical protein
MDKVRTFWARTKRGIPLAVKCCASAGTIVFRNCESRGQYPAEMVDDVCQDCSDCTALLGVTPLVLCHCLASCSFSWLNARVVSVARDEASSLYLTSHNTGRPCRVYQLTCDRRVQQRRKLCRLLAVSNAGPTRPWSVVPCSMLAVATDSPSKITENS